MLRTCRVQLTGGGTFKTCYWNRRTGASVWKPPPGVKVVWVGTEDEEAVRSYWDRRTRVSRFDLPPLPPG